MIFILRRFQSRLLKWFDQSRRDLPWRLPLHAAPGTRLDPYFVLISEAMLQQTQVSTVIPYFHRFLRAFPGIRALADADEQQVLRLWQGLGYYSRARNLHRAAKEIVTRFGGVIPDRLDDLLSLPGVGRYTAGAIASIAFDRCAPILDGNVVRVICRLDRIETDPREKSTQLLLWQRAEEILPPVGKRVGDFNSALMELGATVCTPRNPQCLICPVRTFCRANAEGVQDRIPAPRKTKVSPQIHRWTFCIRLASKSTNPAEDHYLIEQRPATGRWAGMWQFVTIEPPVDPSGVETGNSPRGVGASPTQSVGRRGRGAHATQDQTLNEPGTLNDRSFSVSFESGIRNHPTPQLIKRFVSIPVTQLKQIGSLSHTLTHRRYTFDIFTCVTKQSALPASHLPRLWATLSDLDRYPLPRPHLKIVDMLRANDTA